jgi:hypothetical protein
MIYKCHQCKIAVFSREYKEMINHPQLGVLVFHSVCFKNQQNKNNFHNGYTLFSFIIASSLFSLLSLFLPSFPLSSFFPFFLPAFPPFFLLSLLSSFFPLGKNEEGKKEEENEEEKKEATREVFLHFPTISIGNN